MDQRMNVGIDDPVHPAHPPGLHPSLLRLSVPARFLIAACLGLLLWGAVFWALN